MGYTKYVAGFLFRRSDTEVALIRKEKPAWQRGRLNGIGGKIEADEDAKTAMVREFQEETGAEINPWRKFCTLYVPQAQIFFFESRMGDSYTLTSTTEERVDWYRHDEMAFPAVLRGTPLWNLRWLIPMALDPDQPVAIVRQDG